jgi:hypothetical protein
MSREAIYAALFAKLAAIPGLQTSSRRLRHYTDVPGQQQPALFLEQRNEGTAQGVPGLPGKRTLRVHVWLYVRVDDHAAIPATALNAWLDAVDTALAPEAATGKQTLGGLVAHCWVNGITETDDGSLDSQAIARIPVEILIP